MPRLRRYLVPTLLLLPLILLCGKLLLTPVTGFVDEWDIRRVDHYMNGINELPTIERGWPWVYQKTYVPGMGWMQDPPQTIYFSRWSLAADVLSILAATATCAFLLDRHWRRARGWFRLSLRELFAAVTLIAIVCAWWLNAANDSTRELATQEAFRNKAIELKASGYSGPEWLARLWPEAASRDPQRRSPSVMEIDFRSKWWQRRLPSGPDLQRFDRFQELYIADEGHGYQAGDELQLPALPYIQTAFVVGNPLDPRVWKKLPNLEDLTLNQGAGDDENLAAIGRLEKLRHLQVNSGGTSDRGVEHLISCSSLASLHLDSTNITDKSLRVIAHLKGLQHLSVGDTQITDRGVAELTALPTLKIIELESTQITDSALASLRKITTLEAVYIESCRNLTDHGLQLLLDLPNLTVVAIPGPPQIGEDTLRRFKERFKDGLFWPTLFMQPQIQAAQ